MQLKHYGKARYIGVLWKAVYLWRTMYGAAICNSYEHKSLATSSFRANFLRSNVDNFYQEDYFLYYTGKLPFSMSTIVDQEPSVSQEDPITASQKARIERNRQRALLLRQSRLVSHPYLNKDSGDCTIKIAGTNVIDSGAGFFIEESTDTASSVEIKLTHPLPPIILNKPSCNECKKEFEDSFLYIKFNESVCDECRDHDGKHKFITKTDAKAQYLLKDCDLEKREPPLKFISKKNSKNPTWGNIHLYLQCQVERRALEIWESEEKLEEAKEKKTENIERLKQKRYNKKLKELRKAVRSSLYRKETTSHQHEYGPEKYDEDEDTYSKSCKSCGHTVSYEKM